MIEAKTFYGVREKTSRLETNSFSKFILMATLYNAVSEDHYCVDYNCECKA